jgi:CRP-like cAMP-binding protein
MKTGVPCASMPGTEFDWAELPGVSEPQAYPAGVELFRQGDVTQYVYFLERGLLKTQYTDVNGQELIISLLGSFGGIVGASCAVLEKHCVSATVLSDSLMRYLPAARMRELLRSDVRVSWRVHQLHCRMLHEQLTQRLELGSLSARRRFEQLLWQLIQALDGKSTAQGVRMQLPLKYWEIAQLIVVTPEHLCRIVRSLEAEGLLRRDKGWMIVSEPHKLWHENKNVPLAPKPGGTRQG